MLIFLLNFLACPKPAELPETPQVELESPATPETPVTPQAPEDPHAGFFGTHSSPECGDERKYPRHVVLSEDMSYTLTDLVSPCPPGGMCAWSGVVTAKGTWAVEGPMVVFTEGKVDNSDKGAPRPDKLTLGQTGQLMESRCLYVQSSGPADAGAPPAP